MYRFFAWFGFSGKRVLSCLLSLFAIILFVINPSAPRALVVVAMLFSTAGDFFMSGADDPSHKGNAYFIKGGLVFAVAHLSYVAAYLVRLNFDFPAFNWGSAVAVALFILGLLMMLLMRRTVINRKLWQYCLAYLLIIAANGFVVCTYAAHMGGIHLLAGVGAVCFILSDALIALRTFSHISFFSSQAGRDLVWWLYPIGQILLIAFI